MGVLDFMNKDRKEQADGEKNTEKSSTKNRKVISTKAKKRRCRALFIGINYPGTHAELRGCVNDVKMMMNVLEKIGFPLDDIRILVDADEIRNCHAKPTKQNILDSMRWLVEGAQDGDTLFLHFSGHGTQVKDATGDEEDGKDEALVPCDFVSAGYLLDDEIVQNVLAPLPAGVRLTALLDCCHSGTLMDLPFIWIANEENTSRRLESGEALMKFSSKKSAARSLHSEDSDYIERDFAATGTSTRISADVVLFSGCRDEQTSADVTSRKKFNIPVDAGPGGAGGACTSALTEVLMSERNIPFVLLLEKMRVNLKARRFTQVPQLSASRPIDLTLPFSFFGLIHT